MTILTWFSKIRHTKRISFISGSYNVSFTNKYIKVSYDDGFLKTRSIFISRKRLQKILNKIREYEEAQQ